MTDDFVPAGARVEHLRQPTGTLRLLRGGPSTTTGRWPLVLVHGGGSDNAAISWSAVLGPLATQRPVVALDLPGFGGSRDVPVSGDPRALADLVASVVVRLGWERAVFAGVSMGGDVVLNVGLRHPGRVAALVLVAPGGLVRRLSGTGTQTAAWLAAQLPDPVLFALARLANRFTGAALRAMVHDPRTLPGPVAAEFVREARRPGAAVGYARYNQATLGRYAMRNFLLPEVGRITAPSLFLHGTRDRLVDPAGSVAAAARMPDARVVLVEDCGHWVPVEQPARFLAEVQDFLADVDARPGA